MSQWKIEKCENGYLITYSRESHNGVPGKCFFRDWRDVIVFFNLVDGNALVKKESIVVSGERMG